MSTAIKAKLTARKLIGTAQHGQWAAHDEKGSIMCVRPKKREALEAAEKLIAERGSKERAVATDSKERQSFIERLESLGQ